MPTGETREFRVGTSDYRHPVYLRPGSYQIEAGCNRSGDQCGFLKGWLHMDRAPTIKARLAPGESLEIECKGASPELILRAVRPNTSSKSDR